MYQIEKSLSSKELALYFDHTLLRPEAVAADFEKICENSMKYGFCMVAINPAPVSLCKRLLSGSQVRVGAAIGFPLGQNTIETKIFETKDAIENGADEIDYVVNITELKEKNYAYIEKEMFEIVNICRLNKKTSKVIFENCFLTEHEKIELCHIASNVRPDFVKTSTGFGSGGATIEDLKLMKKYTEKSGIKLKASGGVRTLDTVLTLIELGVERIGSTASVSIIEEFQKRI